MEKTTKVKNLILGGGLSGLATAYFLNNDDTLVLEKDSTPGGYCRTIPNDKYVWDYAGHFYHFKTEKYKKLFQSMVEPSEIVEQVKNTKIYYGGKLIDYPFQMNIHQLEQPEFIDCLYDLVKKDEQPDYDNYLEMLYAKFGKSITEKFLKPYNEKLYATDLRNLDTGAMGRFFPYADLKGIILNMKESQNHSYNDTFLYLKQGTGYFIDKLYDQVKSKVKLGVEVLKINPEKKLVSTSQGDYQYERLISTLPFNQLLRLLGGPKLDLSYNQVLVLNLGFDRPSPKYTQEHWVYFPDKNLNFYRIGFYNNILGQDPLSVYVEIGFNQDAEIDVDRELKATLEGMKKVGIIDDDHQLVDYCALIMDPAYVHIATETDQQVKDFTKELEKSQIYTLGRYGKWTYNSMEDCMELADDLVEKLQNEES